MFVPLFTEPSFSQYPIQNTSKKDSKSSGPRKVVVTTCKIKAKPETLQNCENTDLKNLEGRISEDTPENSCLKLLPHLLGITNGGTGVKEKASEIKAEIPNRKTPNGKLSKTEKELLKNHVYLYPEHYSSCKSFSLNQACRYSDEPALQKELLTALFKLGASPYTLDSIGRPIYEQFIDCSQKDVNLAALQFFFDKGLDVKHLPLINLVYNDLFDLFKEAVDKGASLNQKCYSKTPHSSFFLGLHKDECVEVPLFHSLVYNKNHPSQFFESIKGAEDLDINAVNENGQTLIMCLLNNPNAYAEQITWLLSHKPNMEILDKEGRSALFYLLMSTNRIDFRKYFITLCDAGFDFQKVLPNGFTHSQQCLRLIADLSITQNNNGVCDFEKNPDLLQSIHFLLQFMDYTRLSFTTYLTLPKFLQEALQNRSRIKSFRIGRFAKMTPKDYHEYSNFMTPSRKEKLEKFWLRLFDAIPKLDPTLNSTSPEIQPMKALILRAFTKSGLNILLSSSHFDKDTHLESIFLHLLRVKKKSMPLDILIRKKVYLKEELFVEAFAKELLEWKDEQIRKAISDRRQLLSYKAELASNKVWEAQEFERLFKYNVSSKASVLRNRRIDSLAYTDLV